MKKLLQFSFLIFTVLLADVAYAQSVSEAVYFTDKNNSPYSVSQPQVFLSQRSIARRQRQNIPVTVTDFPPNPSYVDSLRALGATVWYTSRWMNAAVIRNPSAALLAQINTLGFVTSSQNLMRSANGGGNKGKFEENLNKVEKFNKTLLDPLTYGSSLNQNSMICADSLHSLGLNGKGMMVAVLDNGFKNVNNLPAFSHLFAKNRIKATYDFGDNESFVYNEGNHGTNVLSCIAAFDSGNLIGTAYEADFVLCRTEVDASETRNEEMNWILGAEFADSVGADVINTSLGYNTFDNPAQNYSKADLDGQTALITRGANMASRTGMLLVNSAGNEGGSPWQKIIFPADSDSLLAIGAVNANEVRAGFSSQGPTADGRIKPDLMAKGANTIVVYPNGAISGGNGTSFAGPVFAGMAASLWQAVPNKTNFEMMALLRQSGDRAANPDTLYGYGVPCAISVLDSLNFDYDSLIASLLDTTSNPTDTTVGPDTVTINPKVLPFDFKVINSGNFSNGQFTLEFTGVTSPIPAVVTIYDIVGKKVFEISLTIKDDTLNVKYPGASMREAVYVVAVRTGDDDVKSKKVILR